MGPEVPGRERGFKLPHVSKGCLLQASADAAWCPCALLPAHFILVGLGSGYT